MTHPSSLLFLLFSLLFIHLSIQTPLNQLGIQLKQVECQSVVANYEGKFEQAGRNSYLAQFQLTLKIQDEQIGLFVDHWNSSYSNAKQMPTFQFENSENTESCQSPYTDCWLPFSTHKTDYLDVGITFDEAKDFYEIINFPTFVKSFQLNKPKGQCTNSQAYDSDPLPNYCVCCGDYIPTDKSLKCPKIDWPIVTTLSPPVLQTTTQKLNDVCQSVVSYLSGQFQMNGVGPIYYYQFQARLTIKNNRVIFISDNINSTYTKDYPVAFQIKTDSGNVTCNAPYKDCSIALADEVYNTVELSFSVKDFVKLFIFNFDNVQDGEFRLYDPVGQCFSYQLYNGRSYDTFCGCCDSYNPVPQLECPESPWN